MTLTKRGTDRRGLEGPTEMTRALLSSAVLYRCFAADGTLLYIGCSSNLKLRQKQHARVTPWWPEVASITTEPYEERWQALAAERTAIVRENPRHNALRHFVNLLPEAAAS